MHRKFRKAASAVLAASMLFTSCLQGVAQEQTTEAVTEKVTEQATEKATEKATEAPQTEAPTEAPATEAPTEAPQTEAPSTEAPQTEAPTEAPQTETEKATEAPQTETPAEQETETETEEESETEKETKAEKETERSERKNDGKKMTSSDLVSGLGAALPYLFAAGSVNGPGELLEDQAIADGAKGQAVVSGLESFSVELANARSSSDVKVINLYADKNGKLDTAQLDKVSGSHVLDVTNKYYVVNVIAYSENQSLSFSGYDLVLSGAPVVYEDGSEAGDILYNFAALDGDEFTGYEGTVTLSGGKLKGTFLAPEANVNVNAGLAGAVYADAVSVADSVDELMRIVLVKGSEAKAVSEDETESQTAAASEAETTASPESESAAPAGGETIPETEAQTELASGAEVSAQQPTEAGESESPASEAESAEPESPASEAESTEPESPASEAESAEPESPATELETESEISAELPIDMETVNVSRVLENAAVFGTRLADTDGDAQLSGGVFAVRAAEDIIGEDGSELYAKDAAVEQAVDETGNVKLTNSGSYYLELAQIPDGYLGIPRIYFSVDASGVLTFGTDGGEEWTWDETQKLLTVSLHGEDDQTKGVPVLSVTDGNGNQISEAVFVLYAVGADGETAVNYISYAGSPVALAGLAAGSYRLSQLSAAPGYQIAPDNDENLSFTVEEDKVISLDITNSPKPADGKTLTVSAELFYNNVLLTAEGSSSEKYYAALFSDADPQVRVSAVYELDYQKDARTSIPVVFDGLSETSYYLTATDEFGVPVQNGPYQAAQVKVTYAAGETARTAELTYQYAEGADYPDGFYYIVPVTLTKNVLNYDGKELAVTENFYANLYGDQALTQKLTQTPVTIRLKNAASASSAVISVKMTAASGTIYLVETDQSGAALAEDYKYTVTYPDTNGALTVSCRAKQGTSEQEPVNAVIQNKLNSSIVKIRVVDASSGARVSGATLVLKDSKGRAVNVNNTVTFTSKTTDLVWTNRLTEGETYYLSEVSAPSGYTPVPDVEFTVKAGETTEVVMENSKTASTKYEIAVTKQVYNGSYPVYARDTTNGTYAAEGRYTFYAALFSDAARTQKVSNVQKITVTGFGGTTTFTNLKKNTTYYVAETNEYGEVVSSTGNLTVQYSNDGKVATSSTSQTAMIQNIYSSLPAGYRHTGTLTITKNVKNSSGEAEKVTDTFYAGIFRKSDYSDTPTIVKLELNNASTVSVTRRILLSGSSDMTYYIAEVDSSGKRLSNSQEFGYSISIDNPTVAITKGSDRSVTITNQAKSSKVTLYITKRVYEGTSLKAVNETFYAGLFKDANFTQLYTKPIPLSMSGKSELTLKLSLNLGNTGGAKIYVAEVDANGNVIKNQQSFGYEIKLVNSTADFSQSKLEHQTILLNSVYGTTSSDDWNRVLSRDGNNLGSGEVVSGNGTAAAAAQTGDNTPILWYLVLMGASLAIFAGCRRRRRSRR